MTRGWLFGHAVAGLMVFVCSLVSIPARAGPPGDSTRLRVDWRGVPETVQKACGELGAEGQKRLGCDGYWSKPAVVKLARAGAPARAFAPNGVPLCDAVRDLSPAPKPGTAGARLRLDCGVAGGANPARLVKDACGDVRALVDAKKEEADLAQKPGRSRDEEQALKAARDRLRAAGTTAVDAAVIFQEALACGDVDWGAREASASTWDGDPSKSPTVQASGRYPDAEPLCARIQRARGDAKSSAGFAHVQALFRACGVSAQSSAVPTVGAAAFAVPLLQGLGDFLEARAKEEFLAFAIERLGKEFCATGDRIDVDGLSRQIEAAGVAVEKREKISPLVASVGTEEGAWWRLTVGWKDGSNRPAQATLDAGLFGDGNLAAQAARSMKNGFAIGRAALATADRALGKRLFRALVKLDGVQLFPESCAALFPRGVDHDPDLDAIYSSGFQKVIAGELLRLPIRLLAEGGLQFDDASEERQLRIVFYELARGLRDAITNKDRALDFLAGLEPAMRAALTAEGAQPTTCRFVKGEQPSSPCTALLLFTVLSHAGEAFSSGQGGALLNQTADGEGWLWRSAVAFCKTYGGVDDAKCLLQGSTDGDPLLWAKLRAAAEAVVDFHNAVATVIAQHEAAVKAGKPPYQAGLEAAAGVTTALDGLTTSIVELTTAILDEVPAASGSAATAGGARKNMERLKQVISLLDGVLKAASAATKRDFHAVAAGLRVVFTSGLLEPQMSPRFRRGVLFVFAVAEAKTRDDVRKALEDNAAPPGSYRAKYQSRKTLLAINGYVGVFGGLRFPLVRADSPNFEAPDVGFGQPLSAPVGLDVSGPALAGGHHLGLALLALDPLALRISQSKESTTQVDLQGVLAPGAFLRWGMFRSPIVFMIGARVQPLLRSTETNCGPGGGEKACWQAPFSAMAGFAVDIPILQLN
jgi:hypothetical protein